MSTEPLPTDLYIDGKFVPARDGGRFEVLSPIDGAVFGRFAAGREEDLRAAIDSATAAQSEWAARPYTERAAVMLRAADVLLAKGDRYREAMCHETGSTFGKAMFETNYVPNTFRTAAASVYQVQGETLPSDHGKVSLVERTPVGVVGVISPWNFPLLLSARSVAFALVLGNAVLLKPSEESPTTGGLLIAEILEEAGLPAGLLNVVPTSREHVEEVGNLLVDHPAVGAISFTGSERVGRALGARAGQALKKICLELGGKDALIVREDADLDRAVAAASFGSFMNQGQVCMSVERILVDAKIADEFTERLVERTKGIKCGDPRDKSNAMGPLINEGQLARVRDHVDQAVNAGASVLCGGGNDGLYFEPTVMSDVSTDMAIWRDETFGPVAPVMPVSGDEEAIAIANDSPYGLSAGVITADEERGLEIARRLETGMAHVNDASIYDEPHVPFGGEKASGIGRQGIAASIDTFTTTRWLTLERGGRTYPPGF